VTASEQRRQGQCGASCSARAITPSARSASSRLDDVRFNSPYGQDHEVLVQVPLSLGLTDKQIVSFAQGITVTSAALAANG
jgi:hypothetical protein